MKLVIDIQEEDYTFFKEIVADGITNPLKICIANGTPLEEVLGEIKWDIESCREKFFWNEDGTYSPYMSGTLDRVLEIIDEHIGGKEKHDIQG